jgi:ADP-ribosylglycohydrolase
VRFGHDTDTTAAVAGSLAGAVFGAASSPAQGLEQLRLNVDQRRLIAVFVEMIESRPPPAPSLKGRG